MRLWRPVRQARDIGWGALSLAALLTAWAVLLVTGAWPGSSDHAGALAAMGVLAMTVPVAWARRAPLAAAVVVAAGALVNELLIGHLVRCGPCLPAVLIIAFFAGTRPGRRRLVAAAAACMVNIALQSYYDPRLGPGFTTIGLPAVALACLAGWLVHERGDAATKLRARNAELRAQRERTAELAVAADRARVAGDLHDFVKDRISAMAEATSAGRDLLAADPAVAQNALARVETSGRETLAYMREVVGNLRTEQPLTSPPVLADLDSLLDRATTADARLRVSGSPRALPAGLELSAYRIVEHLLEAMEDTPGTRIDVHLRFGGDALELDVSGPPSQQQGPAFAAVRQRVAMLGGTLHIEALRTRADALAGTVPPAAAAPSSAAPSSAALSSAALCTALVRLPLAPGYAGG